MRKSIVIILMLVGFSSFGQTPSSSDTANMLKQPAVWKFPNKIWFKGNVFITNVVRKSNGQQRILVQNTNTGRIEYIDSTNFVGNYWSTSGNTFSNGNYLGTSNNRGLPIVINGKKQVYFDTLAGVNLYDRNASRILSIYKNNSAASRTGTVYNSRPDSTNSSKSGHIFIADGANTSPAAGTYYSTVAIQQGSLSTSGTGIASSLLVQPQTIIQSSGSGYISGVTINSGNTIGGGALYFRGLDIPNCGNNSNAYGIHQADAVGRNYFAASTQFGSTTTSTSAQVQINSTTKGFLPPVMTNAQKNAISSPATGLVVYDNGTNKLNYYNGSSWRGLDSSSGGSYLPLSGGTLTGNLLFTDNTYDIGASGATRPRTGYFGTSIISPAITSTGSLGIVVDNASGDAIIRLSDGFGQGGRITTIGNNGGGELQNYDGSAPSLRWNGGGINIGSSANPIGKLSIPTAPTASANYGLVSLGSGAFDGSTSGYFTGSANGTLIAGNLASGSTSDLMNLQMGGVSKIKADKDGRFYAGYMYTKGSMYSAQNEFGSVISATIPMVIEGDWGGTGATAYGVSLGSSQYYGTYEATSFDVVRLGSMSFSKSSGSLAMNFTRIAPTINQTGTATGITRGLYINPTLTSAADFRAIDVTDGAVNFPYTNTATATTGNQTINKISGQVNIAAAGTTVTVTNSLVTTNSIVQAVIMTNDATATLRNVVVSAGSFVINIVACTSETRIGFFVINR